MQGHTTRADAVFLTAQIKDAVGNEYGRPKDIVGETRMAFTSHADAAFDVCFENQLLSSRKPTPSLPDTLYDQCVLSEPNPSRRRKPIPPHRTRHRHRRRRPRLVRHSSVGKAETGRDGAEAHRGAGRGDCHGDGLPAYERAEAEGYE